MLVFTSHKQASQHFKKRECTVKLLFFNKEYILDKSSLSNKNTIKKPCKTCGKICTSTEVKYGNCNTCKQQKVFEVKEMVCKVCNNTSKFRKSLICKSCSEQVAGRKEQAKILSEKYKGFNNPNFSNGQSEKTFYTTSEWRKVKQFFKNSKCAKCGSNENIHLHHIISAVFLTESEKFNNDLIIPLCSNHHKELHHLQIDIELLPDLYQQYKKDVKELRQFLITQPQFQSMSFNPYEKYHELYLIQCLPSNYLKTVQNRHFEFFQKEFSHLLLK